MPEQTIYPQILVGTIVACFTPYRAYAVQVGGREDLYAYPLLRSSGVAGGMNVSDQGTYQPGDMVALIVTNPGGTHWIIGALPQMPRRPGDAIAPILVPDSARLSEEEFIKYFAEMQDGPPFEFRPANAADDRIAGDAGSMSNLGTGIWCDEMQAVLRAGHECGIQALKLDRVLRFIAMYWHEMFKSDGEIRIANDEGELHVTDFRCKYPWEAFGTTKHGTKIFQDAPESVGEIGAVPVEPASKGAWRDVRLGGYLGDIEHQFITRPSDEAEDKPLKFDNKTALQGLSRVHRAADGALHFESAKQLLFVKRPLIPVPQQLTLPDDDRDGDRHDNYKASGQLGSGGDPVEQEEFKWPETGDRAAALWDYVAYRLNWHGLANVLAHKKDWYVPEQSELSDGWKVTRQTIRGDALSSLSTEFLAKVPESFDIDIDARLKKVKYYESSSCIGMLDDGTVVLEDGWGGSIRMSRGNITISCPGDIIMQPGRNVVALAPRDLVLRARRSADFTADTGDVRIKAERNCQILGGNDSDNNADGVGGVVIESRSRQSTEPPSGNGEDAKTYGITLISKNAGIGLAGNEIYIGSKQIEGGSSPLGVTIDAADTLLNIKAQTEQAEVKTAITEIIGDNVTVTHMRSSGMTTIPTDISVKGMLAVMTGQSGSSGLLVNGPVVVEGPGMFSGTVHGESLIKAGEDAMIIPGAKNAVIDQINTQIELAIESVGAAEECITNLRVTCDAIVERQQLSKEGALNKPLFSLRTNKDYGVTNLKLSETRWQRLVTALGTPATEPWKAAGVKTEEQTNYPWPGDPSQSHIVTVSESSLTDPSQGLDKDRGDGSTYAQAASQGVNPEEKPLDQYPVMTGLTRS